MRLRSKRHLRRAYTDEDFSPMEGVGNMADAMLVFACGILLALIISWNIEISERGEISQQGTRYEVENIGQQTEETLDPEADLEEMGKVYRDPDTGKYYVIENIEAEPAQETP
ncbi:MAG: DUF2149 domain-containing protein [Mogibacterium sp.]|nr:DUF2149 domain-containing protein [Mogibacterium sp.]